MKTEELRPAEDDCSGCGACAARCPRGAIVMREGSDGFVYPEIDEIRCVDCGLCRKTCGLQNRIAHETEGPWYAAAYRGDSSASASAGAFYALARAVVDNGGVVFGAAYVNEDDGLHVRHVMAADDRSLRALQGSKYVQSDARTSMSEVSKQLRSGRDVLFAGTPCQVAGLRGYLGRGWPNLITVDLVCHGVPSETMFRSMVSSLERRYEKRVIDFRFRCKREGWGHSLLLLILRPFDAIDGSHDEEILIHANESAYYELFMRFQTLRDSCYSCPFAGRLRPGDITVGDFWGIENVRPDLLKDDTFDIRTGVSCLLVNTGRGRRALGEYGGSLKLTEVPFEEIAAHNDQLRHPSLLPKDRSLYLDAFRNGGWDAVEMLWRCRERGTKYHVKQMAKSVVPKWLIGLIKGIAATRR